MNIPTFKLIGVLVIIGFWSVITSCSNQTKTQVISSKSDTIVINLMQFSPAKLNAVVGDTITWINKDLVDHNVSDTINRLFYSDTIKPGKTFRWVVTGEVKYICTIHPTMNAEIILSGK